MADFDARLVVGDGYAVISLVGELDLGTVPALRSCVEQVTRSPIELVVFDATELEFIDSSGLAVFVGVHKQLTPNGTRVVLANVPPRLAKPIRVTGLATVIPTQITDEPRRPWEQPTSMQQILLTLGFVTAPVQPTCVDEDSILN